MDIQLLDYSDDNEMEIHDDVKPYHHPHQGDYGEDDYDQTSPSAGTSNAIPTHNLVGHEDLNSIGLRPRFPRFKQDDARLQRIMSGQGGGMFQYSPTRPKRVLQNWERVNSFPNAPVAEEALKRHQGCRWMKGNKSNTKEGRKEYYACREGTACPAMVHLLYDAKSPRVYMFQNDSEHVHIGERKRGLPVQVEQIIRDLFASGTRKPSQIQNFIVKKGLKEIQKSQLANFLQKIKKEMGETETETDSFYTPEVTDGGFHASWLGTPESDTGTLQQGDSQSSLPGLGGIAPLAFAAAEYNTPSQENSPSPAGNGNNLLLNFSGLTPSHTLQHERSGTGTTAPGPNVVQVPSAGNQSEIVSSSCGKKFYCRDESTEDGEHCLPNEENIKELILQHLRANYSNRDMLHIRDELRTLKKEKKYPVLNRLVSFTAGFLQDTFMEDHSTN